MEYVAQNWEFNELKKKVLSFDQWFSEETFNNKFFRPWFDSKKSKSKIILQQYPFGEKKKSIIFQIDIGAIWLLFWSFTIKPVTKIFSVELLFIA